MKATIDFINKEIHILDSNSIMDITKILHFFDEKLWSAFNWFIDEDRDSENLTGKISQQAV